MPDRQAAAGWGPQTREHTFQSGQVATLKATLQVWDLMRSGVFTEELVDAFERAKEGRLGDASAAVQLTDVILAEIFVSPRVTADKALVDYAADPQVIHVSDVPDAVIDEVYDLAFGGARAAEAFRGNPDGATSGADGEGVERPAEPTPRRAPRKRRGVAA